MRLKLLVMFAVFTGAVLVFNLLLWQGRGKPLSEDRRSLVEFSQVSFPLALALLVIQWLLGLTAELVVAVFTAYTGLFVVLDKAAWRHREVPIKSGLQSLVEFSHATFPMALLLMVLQWYFGLTLALVLTVLTLYAGFVVGLNRFVWQKRRTPFSCVRAVSHSVRVDDADVAAGRFHIRPEIRLWAAIACNRDQGTRDRRPGTR